MMCYKLYINSIFLSEFSV